MRKKFLLFIFSLVSFFTWNDVVRADTAYQYYFEQCQNESMVVTKGSSIQFMDKDNFTWTNAKWKSSDQSVVSIKESNMNWNNFVANKVGTAKISYFNTAGDGSGVMAFCLVTVVDAPDLIIKNCETGNATVFVGETLNIQSQGYNTNEWVLYENKIIETNGDNFKLNIKGLKPGKVDIFSVVEKNENGIYTNISKKCTIEVKEKKEPVKSTNNYLKDLSVSGYTFKENFDKNKTDYTVILPTNINSINIEAVPEDTKASINGIGIIDVTNKDKIKIEVTSEAKETKTYSIKIERKNSNINVSNIEVRGFELNKIFDSNITSYSITVPNDVTSIDLNVLTEDDKLNVKITGNKELEEGYNTVRISITNDDNEQKNYTISVYREKLDNTKNDDLDSNLKNNNKDNKDNNTLIIVIVSIAIVVVGGGVTTLLIIKNKKRNIINNKSIKAEPINENISDIPNNEVNTSTNSSNSNIDELTDIFKDK